MVSSGPRRASPVRRHGVADHDMRAAMEDSRWRVLYFWRPTIPTAQDGVNRSSQCGLRDRLGPMMVSASESASMSNIPVEVILESEG